MSVIPRARIVPSPGGIARLQADPRYQAFRHEAALAVAASVRIVAPRGRTGDYARSIVVRGGEVHSVSPWWHLVEYGSVNNSAYAPLRRGTRAAGLALREAPKP